MERKLKLTVKTFVLLLSALAIFFIEIIAVHKIAYAQISASNPVTGEASRPESTAPQSGEVTAEKNTQAQQVTRELNPAQTERSIAPQKLENTPEIKVPAQTVILNNTVTPEIRPLAAPATGDLIIAAPQTTGELAVQNNAVTSDLKPLVSAVTGDLTIQKNAVTAELGPARREATREVIPEGFGKIGIDLPLESKLEITGRKGVALNYGNVVKTNPPAGVPAVGGNSASGITSGFSLLQDLQVRLSGTVGKRVTVNVDYDDTKEQQRDISLIYKGAPDELIEHAQFGDVMLTLPNTEFTGYSKSIFGGDVQLRYKNLNLKVIGAQTKGITKTVTFTGGYSQQKIDIQDVAFIRQKYYKIQTDVTGSIPTGHLPITPGSEQIWLDDMNGYNNNYPPNYPADRGTDITKYTQKTKTEAFSLDYLHPGTDYTIDYTTGIITFNKSIQQNYVIVAAYKYNNGSSSVGYDTNGVFDFDDSVVLGSPDPSPDDTLFGKLFTNRFVQPPLGSKYYYDCQIMNYYNLGNKKILLPLYDPDFVFRIYDQNNIEQPITNYRWALDVDSGNLNIYTSTLNEKPFTAVFPPDAYPRVASQTTQTRYKMHLEYKYKFKTYQLPNFSIVKYSETIMMDGLKKTRDLDYTIDYDSGFIFFMNEDKITDKTQIIVTYEYMPFGGGFQSNLFGARAELKLDALSFGSTYLYTGAQSPSDVPVAGSTPQSLSILDVDTKMTAGQAMIDSVFGRLFFLPTELSFSGEIAKSIFNPNIYQAQAGEPGTGMIDGMEASDNISGLSSDYNSWFSSSKPPADTFDFSFTPDPTNRGERFTLSNYDDYGHDTTSTVKKQLLQLDYNLGAGQWDSIRYVVSASGADYSKFRYLELWVKASDWTKDVDVNINIGTISEDINGNSVLDTEDTNNDGVLNAGEDTGIPAQFNGITVNAGAGNNRLDKEDLDNNGKLDTDENNYIYSFKLSNPNASNYVASTVGDWKLLKIPLNFSATGTSPVTNGSPSASLIKHIRLWMKSATGAAGSLVIESAQFTGNKWELKYPSSLAVLDVKAINQILDPTYIPVNTFFTGLTTADLNKEQSISLLYTNTNTTLSSVPFVFKTLSKAINFMDYKKMRVDVYKKKTSPGDILFIRIGSDDNNYQEYRVPLDGLGQGWQTAIINIAAPDAFGPGNNFYLNNVKQISMGVYSSGSGNEIWLNNLRLSDPVIKEGLAYRLGGTVKYGDFFSTTVDYKKIDSTFNFFEDASVNSALSAQQTYASVKQNQMYYVVSSNIKPADFMPLSINYRRDEITTSDADKNNPTYASAPQRAIDTYGSNLNLSLLNPLNIAVTANYKKEEVQYLAAQPGWADLKLDSTSGKTYNVATKATLNLPRNFLGLIPFGGNNFEGEFKYADEAINHSLYQDRNSDTISRDTSGKWTGDYEPLPGFNINPYYQLQQSERRGSNFAYNASIANSISYLDDFTLQSISRGAGLGASFSKLPGLTPRVNYVGAMQRDYNINQLRTNSSIEISTDVRANEWFDFLAAAAPTLNISHKISANALYDKYSSTDPKAPINSITDMDIWGLVPQNSLAYNSSQLINDTANGRFKIASLTFNPRASLSYEGNMQSQFLTRTNVYSLGSGLNIENPPLISFLNPQSLDLQYDYKNIVKKDSNDIIISNSSSHTANMLLPFRLSDSFNGSITFSTIMEDRLENNVNYMNRTYNPGIDIYQNLNFTDPIKLPDFLFGGAVIKIDQTVRINYKLNVAMARNSSNSVTVISNVNTDTYIAGAFIQYGFSKNIRADIGLQFNYFIDNISNVNNYYAYGVNIKVSAVF